MILYTVEVDVQFEPICRAVFELGEGIVMEDPVSGFAIRIRPQEKEEDARPEE